MATSGTKLYFIGDTSAINDNVDEYGFIDVSYSMRPFENLGIERVYPIDGMVAYSDGNLKNIWISGIKSNTSSINFDGSFRNLPITPRAFTFFKDHNIGIKEVCSNIASECLFFITNENELYAVGNNEHKGTRFSIPYNNNNEPKLVHLKNVIDVQSSGSVTFALCTIDANIENMSIWSELSQLPRDVLGIIRSFARKIAVYSTKYNSITSNYASNRDLKFKKFEIFKNLEIVKIAVGWRWKRTFFLDIHGDLWISLGTPMAVRKVAYFEEHNIKLRDIQCGYAHDLALDIDGNMYSWGANDYHPCEYEACCDDVNPTWEPTLTKEKMNVIRCGLHHSYCKTVDNKHYLWGSNHAMECIVDQECIDRPTRIDDFVREKYGLNVIDVFPGYYNSTFICNSL